MRAVLIHDRHSRSIRFSKMLAKIPDMEIVMQSHSPGDAQELCAEYTPDLLIMNTFSKETSSLENIAHIKQEFPDIKVFIMIGTMDDGIALKAKEAGADIVARKNLSQDELAQLIRYSQKHYRVFPKTCPDSQEPP